MARQLTNRQAKRSRKSKGFTLIELMVVTAIAGVLGSVAVPKFLGARAVAQTKGAVGGVIGIARECSSWIAAGAADSGMDTPTIGEGDDAITCSDTVATVFPQDIGGKAHAGVPCMDDTSVETDNRVTVTVEPNGDMSCAFSAVEATL